VSNTAQLKKTSMASHYNLFTVTAVSWFIKQ